jgi:hypothetical protein
MIPTVYIHAIRAQTLRRSNFIGQIALPLQQFDLLK